MMYFVLLLFLTAVATGAPKGENKVAKKEGEFDMPFSVIAYKYKMPSNPFYEVRFSNDGLYFVRYPEYTLDIHQFCRYSLIKNDHLVTRQSDKDNCLTKVDLTYWSEEDKKQIILDTYKIDKKVATDKNPVDSITVYKSPEGNVHHVTLALTDKTCRMMRYTVVGDKVDPSGSLVDCKIVESLNDENDKWVAEHKEAAKISEATKIVAEAKAKGAA